MSVSAGDLVPVSRLLAVNGELTHPSPGTGVYVLDYTAPATPGTHAIYATGLSGGNSGPWNFASNKFVYVDLVASAQGSSPPAGFSLGQNFPNPFNPSTQIRFSLAAKAQTTLKVYNLLGEVVSVLADGWMEPGQYTVSWNAGGFPSGVYIYKLESGSATETKRLILLK
ncbi:T9SS C-terminal target domain-containing protein [bacterium]|nr:MAG: T9SS C-terminal target domain-containing protein [bacterium]